MPLSTAPKAGVGITLSYGTGSGPVTYTPILFLADDAEFSGFENAIIEIKILASPNVVKIVGRTDNGTFTGTSYLVEADAGIAFLWTTFQSKASVPWQVQLNDGSTPTTISSSNVITAGTGTTYAFNGPVSTYHPGNFTGEDSPTVEFEIAISGPVTRTIGT